MLDRRLFTALGAVLLLVAVSCATGRRGPAPPAPSLPTLVEPAPRAEPEPTPLPPPPAAPEPEPLRAPAVVRIGLLTDLDSFTLPCCAGSARVSLDGEEVALAAPITVRPAAAGASAPVWRLQVAALREEDEAGGLAQRLRRLASVAADARFDAGSGLFRVRVGAWPSREAAEAAGRALSGRGLDAFWVVSEGAALEDPALEVTEIAREGGRTLRVVGRRLVIDAPAGGALEVAGKRYRGAIVLHLNDRGLLNAVNELPLEDYLRGVVPRELGPGLYPQLEALKAQAVAARSYTLRNLDGFADEGYDLCGTPKCQVYGGIGSEHPLSDRAVAETAGEVLVADGAPIDALYSATCGGRTEDVEVVFPLKRAAYLRGVACIEAGVARLHSAATHHARWPDAVAAASLSRRRVSFEALRFGDLLVRDESGRQDGFAIERTLVTFVDDGSGPRPADLALAAGDELELHVEGERLVAVVQKTFVDSLPLERGHSRTVWSRFKSDAELATSVRRRFPGFDFARFDIIGRGHSGRVGTIRLIGQDGSSFDVSGLAVRWVLDLPDTAFTVRRISTPRARAGWQFAGRGWGHGVGLCQYGSYAMSRRGHDYRSILAHYYTAARLERLLPSMALNSGDSDRIAQGAPDS